MIRKTFLFALLAAICFASGVLSQGIGPAVNGPMYGPNWSQGFVPTPAAWQLMWTNKVDYNATGIPVVYGGTGATSPSAALANLGAISATLAYKSLIAGNASNVATPLATANNGLLVTDAAGIPSIGTAIPANVTFPSPGAIGGSTPAPGTFTTVRATGNTFAVGTLTTWANNQTCTAGQMTWDDSFLYVCTATNTVKRAALSTF